MGPPIVSVSFESSSQFVAKVFRHQYGSPVGVFRAPGRVNLIGEHTDYNDGFVMPAALGFSTYVAVGGRSDRSVSVLSLDFGDTRTIALDDPGSGPTGHWSDYVRGVAAVLQTSGVALSGANLVIKSDVPIGAGLSSSAALEVSVAFALLAVAACSLDRREIAAICQRAERQYAGTNCGIMDQFVSCFGREDHALLLDCRTLAHELLEVPSDVRIVVCNTMVKHELAGGEYNLRRADCEEGVRFLQASLPQIRALRDVDASELTRLGEKMPECVYRRCRHVVTENARVLDAAQALRRFDLGSFGRLMVESHRSLRDDYEVSCPELDLMVDIALAQDGVFGARMTGGGFGGCTVNLVQAEAVDAFQSEVSRSYESATGQAPAINVCVAADGAGPMQTEFA
jgi:galactokinase